MGLFSNTNSILPLAASVVGGVAVYGAIVGGQRLWAMAADIAERRCRTPIPDPGPCQVEGRGGPPNGSLDAFHLPPALTFSMGDITREGSVETPISAAVGALPAVSRLLRAVPAASGGDGRIRIVFGSESGTAAAYAHALARELSLNGFRQVEVVDPATRDGDGGDETPAPGDIYLFVVSTYGSGDAPSNFRAFLSSLERDAGGQQAQQSPFARVPFAIFALGSTQYTKYCGCGHRLLAALNGLRAEEVLPMACGDCSSTAVQTADEVFDAWQGQVVRALRDRDCAVGPVDPSLCFQPSRRLQLGSSADCDALPFPAPSSILEPTRQRPLLCPIRFCTDLNTQLASPGAVSDAETSLLHIGVGIHHHSGVTYQAGDHLAVFPRNMVGAAAAALDILLERQRILPASPRERIFAMIGVALGGLTTAAVEATLASESGRRVVSCTAASLHTPTANKARASPLNILPARVSLASVFEWYLDVSGAPTRAQLRMLLRCAQCPDDRAALQSMLDCPPAGRPTIVDLLREFPSAAVPLDVFIEATPRITPRRYSIASDGLSHPKEIRIVVKRVPAGLCTSYLAACRSAGEGPVGVHDIVLGSALFAYVSHSTFHLPPLRKMKSRALLLIGPGTGVAPLLGFLHRRLALSLNGGRERAPKGRPHQQPPHQPQRLIVDQHYAPCYFYFGCRSWSLDCCLRVLLNEHPPMLAALSQEQSILSKPIRVALSRDAVPPSTTPLAVDAIGDLWEWNVTPTRARKTYVQTLLWRDGERLVRKILCSEDGAVYVCGDAANMARDVRETLSSLLVAHGVVPNRAAGDAHLDAMAARGLYCEDIW